MDLSNNKYGVAVNFIRDTSFHIENIYAEYTVPSNSPQYWFVILYECML